jgi:hypothetical protein
MAHPLSFGAGGLPALPFLGAVRAKDAPTRMMIQMDLDRSKEWSKHKHTEERKP